MVDSQKIENLRSIIRDGDCNAMVEIITSYPELLNAEIGDPSGSQRGFKPIHVAVFYNITSRLVDWLLSQGVDINQKTYPKGETPLLIAIMRRNIELVTFLLRRNADVNLADDQSSETPLMRAAALGEVDLVKVLLEFRPKAYLLNKSNLSAYQMICKHVFTELSQKQQIYKLFDDYALNEERQRLDSNDENESEKTEKEEPNSNFSTPNKEKSNPFSHRRVGFTLQQPASPQRLSNSYNVTSSDYSNKKRFSSSGNRNYPPRSPEKVRNRSERSPRREIRNYRQETFPRYSPPIVIPNALELELEEMKRELKAAGHQMRRQVRLRELNNSTEYTSKLLHDNSKAKERLLQYEEEAEAMKSELLVLREKMQLYEGSDELIQSIVSREKCDEYISAFRVRLEKFVGQRERITKTQCEAQLNCVVCRDRVKSIMFTPCHHLCICHQCHSNHQFSKCPICRNDVAQYLTVYL